MNFPDVNVLIYAHRKDMAQHEVCRQWLESELQGGPYAMSPLVVSAFLRIVTHPKLFPDPTPISKAIEFVRGVGNRSNCHLVMPGPSHLEIFLGLCERLSARGNLIPDLYLASISIESGLRLITADKGFAQVPGLDWGHPKL